jgi:hypothetical protein
MVRSLALCDLPGRMGRTAEPWRRYGIAKIIGQGRGPAAALMADIERQKAKDRLRQNTDRAVNAASSER